MGRYSNSGLVNGVNGSRQISLNQTYYERKVKENEMNAMINMLEKSGVKFTKENVLFVIKDKTNQMIWLEKGNNNSGLLHIVKNQKDNFKKAFNISENEIPNFLKNVMTNSKIVSNKTKIINGKQGYERKYEYNDKYIIVSGIGINGFIVTAYPREKRL